MTRTPTWIVVLVVMPLLGLSGCLNPAVDEQNGTDEPPPAVNNAAPVADAGPDRSVATGRRVKLVGLGTDDDGDPLTFDWQILRTPFGGPVALDDADTPTPSFVPAMDGIYEFGLVVSDGVEQSQPDVVVLRSRTRAPKENAAPEADAGPNRRARTGEEIAVHGTGSDLDGDDLSYRWSLAEAPAGRQPDLGRVNSATARFTGNKPGTYRLALVVSDAQSSSPPDTVRITVTAPNDDGGGDPVEPPVDDDDPPDDPVDPPGDDDDPPDVPPDEPGDDPPVDDPPEDDEDPPGPDKRPPLADAFAYTVLEINDDFSDGDRSGSVMHPRLWQVETARDTGVTESGGRLRIAAGGPAAAAGALRTAVSERFNFFREPLRVAVVGLKLAGDGGRDAGTTFTLAFTSERAGSVASPDAVTLTISADGRLLLAGKENAAGRTPGGAGAWIDARLGKVPDEVHLVLDQSSYRVEAGSAGALDSWSGYHGLSIAAWGARGDGALGLEAARVAASGNGGTIAEVDAIAVRSLPLFDEFSNDIVTDDGHQPQAWQRERSGDTTLSETGDALEIAAGGDGATAYGRVFTRPLRRLNFFAQPLVFSANLEFPRSDSRTTATFELRSTPGDERDGDLLQVEATDSGRLRLVTDWAGGGSARRQALVETSLSAATESFALTLDKNRYALRVQGPFGARTYSGAHGIPFYAWGVNGDTALALGASRQPGATGTALARWTGVRVQRDQAEYIAGTVFGPVGDGVALDLPDLPAAQSLARYGLVDVTQAPFNADATGSRDATEALKSAARYAQQQHLVVFFPPGRYRVSDTVDCTQDLYLRTTDRLVGHREEGACVFVGSRAGRQRPTIFLAPDSRGFDDPGVPRPVVDFRARSYKSTPDKEAPNTSINQMFVNLDIEIGPGNAGAIGIELQGAQGSGIQESTIDATHGYIGIRGGAGSGGSHAGVTVIGGTIGLDLTDTQPNPTLVGITLVDQSRHAIFYMGAQTLTAVGLRIESSQRMQGAAINVPDMNGNWSAVVGQIALIDSSIEFTGAAVGATALSTSRSVYLKDVWARNAAVLVDKLGGARLQGSNSGWRHVREYAQGDTPPPFLESGRNYQYQMPLYLDGERSMTPFADLDESNGAPPADLQSRHLWEPLVPSREADGAVNVMDAPYNAKGDGISDDTDAIQRAVDAHEIVFLPKGYFRVTRPIRLQADTQLVGVSRNLSTLLAGDGGAFSDARNPQPLLQTPDNASARTQVAFLTLQAPVDLPGAYPLEWQSGRRSVFRDVNIQQRSAFGYGPRPGKPDADDRSTPLVRISGNGGGKFYNLYQESAWYQTTDYRHVLVEGTREPLCFYQLNAEHAQSDANVEIRNSTNVDIFGMKSEGNYALLWIRDSDHVNAYGFGGNSSPFAASEGYPSGFANYTPSIVRVERTPNFRLVNIVDYGRMSGDDPIFGEGVPADRWHAVLERPAGGGTLLSRPLDRPVLVKRGTGSE